MNYPKISVEGKDYFQIACKMCEKSESWKIFSDGERFIAKCGCDHQVPIGQTHLQDKRFAEPIPLRFFV